MKHIHIWTITLSILLLAACGPHQDNGNVPQSNTLQKIQRDNVLRIAYINYPPSAFRDSKSGEVTGHFVDTIREIISTLDPKIKLEFVETNWADFPVALNNHQVDLCIAGTFTTIPRAKLVSFTRPLVYLGRGAVVKATDNRWNLGAGVGQFDRSDIKIGVVSGEGSHEMVKAQFKNQGNIVVFDGSDLSQCLAAVSAGQVDVGLSDALETQKYVTAHSETKDVFADGPYNLMPIAWSVRQDDVIWKDFLDTAITTLEVQGKLSEFESRYGFKWSKPDRTLKPRF